MTKKHLFLTALICLPSYQLKAWNPFADQTVREYTYLTAAVLGTGALAYTWIQKRTLQKHYDAHQKRFKNQELFSDSYEDALQALSDYKDYVDILGSSASAQESATRLCQHLTQEFSLNAQLLSTFKKSVQERKQGLEKKHKDIERALIAWEHSKKKGLLTQQGPLLNHTFTRILTTLEALMIHIPYMEALFFIKEHEDILVQERALEQHLTDSAQFKYNLDKLIRAKARVGERYPFRAYAQWIDQYYDLVRELKKELDGSAYYEFQQPVLDYIRSTYNILDTLKKHIKISPEYEAECAQYNAELLARAREDENRKLKEQLAHMKEEMSSLKRPENIPQA